MTNPQFSMGYDDKALYHVADFSEIHEVVLMLHLGLDHKLPADSLAKEIVEGGSTIMLHMHLHGTPHMIDLDAEPEENDG